MLLVGFRMSSAPSCKSEFVNIWWEIVYRYDYWFSSSSSFHSCWKVSHYSSCLGIAVVVRVHSNILLETHYGVSFWRGINYSNACLVWNIEPLATNNHIFFLQTSCLLMKLLWTWSFKNYCFKHFSDMLIISQLWAMMMMFYENVIASGGTIFQ